MSLTQLRHKIVYLQQECSSVVMLHLEHIVRQALASLLGGTQLQNLVGSSGDLLSVDIMYALIRHRYWLRADLPKLLIAEHVTTAHQISWKIALDAVESCTRGLQAILPDDAGLLPVNDREFLRYLFVSALSAESEAALLLDLGLGPSTCNLIRQVLRHSFDEVATEDQFVFTADAKRASLLQDLAYELSLDPELIDDYRLRYHLMSVDSAWRSSLLGDGIRSLLHYLRCLGVQPGLSPSQWLRGMATPQDKDWFHSASDLTQLLEEQQLIHRIHAADKWSLTALGQKLTAHNFVRHADLKHFSEDAFFTRLCAPYQAALLERGDEAMVQLLINRIVKGDLRPVSPQALSQALQKIAQKGDNQRLFDITEELLKRESTPWLRQAAVASLNSLPRSERIAELLNFVARSDGSQIVREAAIMALLQDDARGYSVQTGSKNQAVN